MIGTGELLVFTISEQRCALPLSNIDRVVRMVEVRPLPKAPGIVAGLINVRGRAMPVLDIRKLFRLPDGGPEKGNNLSGQLIIARTSSRPVAILIDSSVGVMDFRNEDVVGSEDLFPGIGHLAGVAKLKDGIVYIYDIDRFLSIEEGTVLDRLLPPGPDMPEKGGRHA